MTIVFPGTFSGSRSFDFSVGIKIEQYGQKMLSGLMGLRQSGQQGRKSIRYHVQNQPIGPRRKPSKPPSTARPRNTPITQPTLTLIIIMTKMHRSHKKSIKVSMSDPFFKSTLAIKAYHTRLLFPTFIVLTLSWKDIHFIKRFYYFFTQCL